ncbi:MAG: hypothetical protein KKG59_02285 [Nanoarchaeota archaeon]|nr:hypothetical protein [Nanoarchaeota archaeon]
MMSNKKGFELALNMLVTIILMIVIIGVGFTMFFNLRSGIQEVDENVAADIQRMIEQEMANAGTGVVVPFTLKESKRGKKIGFPIGIENIFDNDHEFAILVDPKDAGNRKPSVVDIGLDEIIVGAHDRVFKMINIDVPKNAEPGQYGFLIAVCYDDDDTDVHRVSPCSDTSPFSTNYNSYMPPKQMVYVVVK